MENVEHSAKQLVADLKGQAQVDNFNQVVQFAKNFAITNALKHKALVLNLNFKKAPSEEKRSALLAQAFELIAEIEKDHNDNADSALAHRQKRAQEALAAHIQQVKIPDEIVFSTSGLTKTYKNSNFTLGPIDINLRLGQITGVVGENGNGKTTLFRLIIGELGNDEGSIDFPNFDVMNNGKINWPKAMKHIAYVPQELPKWYGSLEDNLKFSAAMHGIKGKDNQEEVDYIVTRLGLEEHINKSWSQLSGGFKARFSLAKALVWKPRLLVIDEPLANLDFKAQQVVLKDLRNLANSLRFPMSIIISSQHLHEVEAVSDDILFLNKGEVTYYGKTKDLGEARQQNTFELDCAIDAKSLKDKLSNLQILDIHHNGVSYVITTPLDVDYKTVLKALMDQGIDFDYFRNISQSVKRLFDKK